MSSISDIRVGDEVTIRAKVLALADKDGDFRVDMSNAMARFRPFVKPSLIATHTPASRQFVVGKMVREKGGHVEYELLGIQGSYLWISTGKNGLPLTANDYFWEPCA